MLRLKVGLTFFEKPPLPVTMVTVNMRGEGQIDPESHGSCHCHVGRGFRMSFPVWNKDHPGLEFKKHANVCWICLLFHVMPEYKIVGSNFLLLFPEKSCTHYVFFVSTTCTKSFCLSLCFANQEMVYLISIS